MNNKVSLKPALKRITDLQFYYEIAAGYCITALWFIAAKYCYDTLPVVLHSEDVRAPVVLVAFFIALFGWLRSRDGFAVGPLVFIGSAILVVRAWPILTRYDSLAYIAAASFLIAVFLYLAYAKARKDLADRLDRECMRIDDKVDEILLNAPPNK